MVGFFVFAVVKTGSSHLSPTRTLTPLFLPFSRLISFLINTYKKSVCNPYRMNTCGAKDLKFLCFQHLRKMGGWGGVTVNWPSGEGWPSRANIVSPRTPRDASDSSVHPQ